MQIGPSNNEPDATEAVGPRVGAGLNKPYIGRTAASTAPLLLSTGAANICGPLAADISAQLSAASHVSLGDHQIIPLF